jgi:alpha-L-fucosidase
VVKSLSPAEKVRAVSLLGYGPVAFSQNYGILVASLPRDLPTAYTNCLAISLESLA